MKVTSKTKEQKSTKERTTLRSISSLLQVSLWKGHCLATWMLFLGPRGRIILGKQRNSGQDNLHLYWSFFLSNRVLSDTWRLHNIKGHSLVSVLFFSYDTRVLNLLDGQVEEVGTLVVLSLPTSTTSEVVSILEPKGIDSQMAGGSTHSLPS